MKTCGKCRESKSVAMFGKNKRYADGIWPYCKACDCARAAEYRSRNPDKTKESCARSNVKNAERVAATKKAYRAANPEKVKASRKAAYIKNRERELEAARKYKADNKAVLAEKAKDWLASNGALNRFYRSERRALERKAKPIWYEKSPVKDIYYLAAQKSKETGEEWHVDHIVPLKSDLVCGLHWHGNMQVITGSENQSKSNRHWPDMPTESQNG